MKFLYVIIAVTYHFRIAFLQIVEHSSISLALAQLFDKLVRNVVFTTILMIKNRIELIFY